MEARSMSKQTSLWQGEGYNGPEKKEQRINREERCQEAP